MLSKRKLLKYSLFIFFLGFLAVFIALFINYMKPEKRIVRYSQRSILYLQDKKPARAIVEIKKALALDPKSKEIRFLLVKAYSESQDAEHAMEAGAKLFQDAPEYKEASLFLINLYLQEKKYQQSLDTCDAFLKIYPGNLDAINQRGITLWKMGYQKQAESEFQKMIQENPLDTKAYINLSRLYWDMNRQTDAILVLINYLQDKDKENFSVRLELGNYYAGAKEYEKAIEKFEPMLKSHPESFEKIAPGYALSLLCTGKLDKAISISEEALKEGPGKFLKEKDPLLIYVRGIGRLESKDYENAINDFLWITRNHPQLSDVYFQLGKAYLSINKNLLAIRELEKAAEINPKSVPIRQNLVQILIQEQQWDKALEHCEALQELTKDSMDTLKWKAFILSQRGEQKKARVIFEKIQETLPQAPEGKIGLAIVDYNEGRYDNAIQKLLELNQKESQDHYVPFLIAQNYFAKKDILNALHYVNLSLEKKSSFISSRVLLSQIRAFHGDIEQSLAEYLKVYEQTPEDEKVILDIGYLYLSLGQSDNALKFLQKADYEKSKKAPFLTLLSKIYLIQNDLKSALQCLIQITNKDSKSYLLIGDIYTCLADYVSAIQSYEMASMVEENYAPYLHIAIAHYLQKHFEEAAAYLEEYLKKKQDNDLAKLFYTIVLLDNKSPDKAWDEIQNLLKNNTSHKWLHQLVYVGICVYQDKEHETKEGFKKLQEYDPVFARDIESLAQFCTQSKTHFNALSVALIFREMGNLHAAVIKCREALQVLLSHPSILYIYADILQRMGQSQEAWNIYQRILQAKDISPYVYAALGKVYFQKRQWKEAENYLLKAVGGFPDLEESLLLLGMLYAGEKDLEKAIVYHEKAKNIALKNKRKNELGQIYNNLAYLYLDSQNTNTKKALEYAEKAFALHPYDASVVDTLGWAYYHNQEYSKAEVHLLYASQLSSKEPTIQYHLARVFLKLNKKEAAIASLKRAISTRKNFPEFPEVQKMLSEVEKN
mgnify:CR=1 FL=1